MPAPSVLSSVLMTFLFVGIGFALVAVALAFVYLRERVLGQGPGPQSGPGPASGSCSKKGCGALDPVSDPAYNMRQIAKQSVLLEEHLAEDRKYCKDCIVKHFLHITGLAEEAVWLAGDLKGMARYPHLRESVAFYNREFETWRSAMDDEATRFSVLARLRDFRKGIVEAYYLA
jgi:hypothetical protein